MPSNFDFANTTLKPLTPRDIGFLMAHFPRSRTDASETAVIADQFPNTLETLLESNFVAHAILDEQSALLNVSPFLFFNVLLRQTLTDHRDKERRKIVNYLAQTLTVFIDTERMLSPSAIAPRQQYITQMIQTAQQSPPHERFRIHVHIGNYALFLTSVFPDWIAHTHRFHKRVIDRRFYIDFGRAYYAEAANHSLARIYGLEKVLQQLARLFDHYMRELNRLSENYFHTH